MGVINKASVDIAKKYGFELRDHTVFINPEHPKVGLRRH